MTAAAKPAQPEYVELHRLDRSRRLRPAKDAHVLALMGCLDDCPPILVERSTWRLVDGAMRVDAADALGRDSLPVTWIEGDAVTILEAAVAANAQHGLPLSLRQRREAAHRMLELAPSLSNRRVARVCGVSEASVRRLARPGASTTQVDGRVGTDGKTYPLTATGRDLACLLLLDGVARSDRAIARAAGLSPTTVGRLRLATTAAAPEATRRRPGLRLLVAFLRRLRGLLRMRPVH